MIAAERLQLTEYDATPLPAVELRDKMLAAGTRIGRMLGLSHNPIETTPHGVRAKDVAGIVRLGPRLELEIAPKFLGAAWPDWRQDFFLLATLSRSGRLLPFEKLAASGHADVSLTSLVARAMVALFDTNRRRPIRKYRSARVQDFHYDGDVEAESLFAPDADGYTQTLLVLDKQNIFNAEIAAAGRALRGELQRELADRGLQQSLDEMVRYLGAPAPARHPRQRVVPSRSRAWQAMHTLAIDVLNGFGVDYQTGGVLAPGYVLETWRVWEDLVTHAVRAGWPGGRVFAQRSAPLGTRVTERSAVTRTVSVTPDLIVDGSLIVDAKYKGRAVEGRSRISEADLYESLAFARATKLARVALIYPATPRREMPTGHTDCFERIEVDGVAIYGLAAETRGIARKDGLKRFSGGLCSALARLS